MIQDVNAAFFPKSVRVKLLNCYTVAAPQSLRPAYVGTLSRPVNESSSRTSKGVYETSHNRSGLRGDCSTLAAARRRHSGGQDDPSRAAPCHRRTIGQSATLTGRRAGRDLSLAPPPPGGGPGRAVIKHSHSSRPARLHDDDDDVRR